MVKDDGDDLSNKMKSYKSIQSMKDTKKLEE
jgi:hypothetical protein